jgi:hypothetical protein
MEEREPKKAIRTIGDDARDLTIGGGIVRVKCGEQHRPADTC